MKYAIIQTGGKQYKVSEGTIVEVEKLDSTPESKLNFDKILLYASDGEFQIGQPNVSGAMVTAKVLEQKRGPKIRVAKFKAKARYRRVTGHRQSLTRIQILKIISN